MSPCLTRLRSLAIVFLLLSALTFKNSVTGCPPVVSLNPRHTLISDTQPPRTALSNGGLLATELPEFLKAKTNSQSDAERVSDCLAKVPVFFEPNVGQFKSQARFATMIGHSRIWLSPAELEFPQQKSAKSLSTEVGDGDHGNRAVMKFIGADDSSKMRGTETLTSRVNYFFGDDPSYWHPNVPTFARLVAEQIYPGIDLTYYGNRDRLEYDLVVAPGSEPSQIRIALNGFDRTAIDSTGALVLSVGSAEVRHDKPVAYQVRDGERVEVAAAFHLSRSGIASFDVGSYDRSLPLTIDPTLAYSTYLGGIDADVGRAILVNASGTAYICGDSRSSDFTHGSASNSDVFVGQITPNGGVFTYSFFGGSSDDIATGLAVDGDGNTYVCGTTRSGDYPKVNSINGAVFGPTDAFITKLNPGGDQFLYSTLIGGSGDETGVSLALDADTNAYLAGRTTSTNFPAFGGVQQTAGGGDSDGFVIKIGPDGGTILYGSYLGGSDSEDVLDRSAIAIDAQGNVYVAGDTRSSDFPTKNPLQATKSGDASTTDAFVTVINAAGTDYLFSTFVGGSGDDNGLGITIDADKNVFLAGKTNSTVFPGSTATRPAANGFDAFVAKISAGGAAFSFLTFIGGTGDEAANGVAVDPAGVVAVTGSAGEGLTTLDAIQTYFTGKHDVFVARLTASGSVNFATYLGGSEEDAGLGVAIQSGSIYVTGFTDSFDYPTSNVVHRQNAGLTDVFVSKIDPDVTPKGPVVLKAVKSGAQLTVFGQNFKDGSTIIVNDKPKATHAGIDPTQVLVSAKGAKKVKPGKTVQVQVQNPNGKFSNFFFFTAPSS